MTWPPPSCTPTLVQEQRYASDPVAVAQSAFVLAAIHQARGLPEEARLVLDRVNDYSGGDAQ